nr:unnamed protein product [Digitaria exilis]
MSSKTRNTTKRSHYKHTSLTYASRAPHNLQVTEIDQEREAARSARASNRDVAAGVEGDSASERTCRGDAVATAAADEREGEEEGLGLGFRACL